MYTNNTCVYVCLYTITVLNSIDLENNIYLNESFINISKIKFL